MYDISVMEHNILKWARLSPNCTVLTPLQGEYAATSKTHFPTMQGMTIKV